MNDILSKLILCEYCHKTFKTEQALISHVCKVQEKYNLGKTREGLLARQVYSYWLKKQKRKVPEYDAFIRSKLFTNFYNFTCFYYLNTETNWEQYVDVMIEQKISPNNWTNEHIIHLYINNQKSIDYESFTLTFIEQCLVDDTLLSKKILLSVDELLKEIFNNNIPITFILLSSTFKHILKNWTTEQCKEFDDFCMKINVDNIMKNNLLIKTTKETLQYFNIN
ncbi:MAG: hypothetical protein KDH96_05585 [Candidatus Riesia sp.]|nr:hypothetical protein [Candidatus Riesia sp.]